MPLIVQIVQHLAPGGLESMALELARIARAKGEVDMRIISLEGSMQETIESWPRLQEFAEILECMDKPPGLKPGAIWSLSRRLKELNPDGVQTHHIGPLIYGGLAARLAGLSRIVHTEHDAWHLRRSNRRRRLQQVILRLVRPTLAAVSSVVAESVRATLSGVEPIVVPNGVDTELFMPADPAASRKQFGLPEGVPLVGCAARLEEVKGVDVLVEASAHLPAEIHVALAGIGTMEAQLQARALELGVTERVHFLGRVDFMPAFYQALDVFCLPSRDEGMPLAPLEAQACGVPAVLTDVGGTRETLSPLNGRMIPPEDPKAMAEAIVAQVAKGSEPSPRAFVQDGKDLASMAAAYNHLLLDS